MTHAILLLLYTHDDTCEFAIQQLKQVRNCVKSPDALVRRSKWHAHGTVPTFASLDPPVRFRVAMSMMPSFVILMGPRPVCARKFCSCSLHVVLVGPSLRLKRAQVAAPNCSADRLVLGYIDVLISTRLILHPAMLQSTSLRPLQSSTRAPLCCVTTRTQSSGSDMIICCKSPCHTCHAEQAIRVVILPRSDQKVWLSCTCRASWLRGWWSL